MSTQDTNLVLETRFQANISSEVGPFIMTPPISEDYWEYRVRLTKTQAIVGFPKFFTIGIGFSVEEDWNTNLPFTCDTEKIFQHIKHNKGDDSIPDDDVRAAIRMVQDAAAADRAGGA